MKAFSGELGQGRKVSSEYEKELALIKEMKAKGETPYRNLVHVV
jgi:hypothetical protein